MRMMNVSFSICILFCQMANLLSLYNSHDNSGLPL